MKKICQFPLIIFIILFICTFLTGCSGSSGDMPSGSAQADYPAQETAEVIEEDAGLTQESGSAAPAVTNRKLIREVTMRVETKDFHSLLTQINTKLTQINGYTESADITGTSMDGDSSESRTAYLILRIPADKLDQFITDVETNGNITNKTETTTDVSLQYADTQGRKKSLEIEQDRVWALLEKADSMENILALEKRLSEIRYELESYESQLRQYDNKVDFSTVTLHISEVRTLTPMKEPTVWKRIQSGLSNNVSLLAKSCVNLFVWVIISSPFLLVLAALIGLVLFLINRSNKKVKKDPQNLPAEKK